MSGVIDCIRDGVGIAVPETTEWQHIGNQIDTAFIFAGSDFVNVHGAARWSDWSIIHLPLVPDTTLEAWLFAVAD